MKITPEIDSLSICCGTRRSARASVMIAAKLKHTNDLATNQEHEDCHKETL
jgi:hypothetical protein